MSYAKIYQQSWVDASGNDIVVSIEEKSISEVAPIPLLPIYGYRFRFNLSRFGIGVLNTSFRIDILDESAETFYNLFNNSLRDRYALRVTVAGNEIFFGFPDWEQIQRKPFEDGRSGISVTFYNPLMWFKNIGYYEAGYNQILADATPGTGQVPAVFARLMDIFNSVLFEKHGLSGNVLKIGHRLETENAVNAGLMGATGTLTLFNALYTSSDIFPEGINVADIAVQIANSFYVRMGWSYNAQLPSVIQIDAGADGGATAEYTSVVITDSVVSYGADNFTVNESLGDVVSPAPVIEQGLIVKPQPRQRDILPYSTVQYQQQGITSTVSNDLISEPYAYPTYRGPSIDFDPNSAASVRVISGTDSANFLFPLPGRFKDPGLDDTLYELSGLLARLKLRQRSIIRPDFSFTYRGYLDPMENHITDFDNNAYIIVRGEYDLIRGETIVQESISIFDYEPE